MKRMPSCCVCSKDSRHAAAYVVAHRAGAWDAPENTLPDIPIKPFLSENADLLGAPVCISAATGAGKQALLDRITALYDDGKIDLRGDAVVSNSRQYADICTAVHHIDEALSSLAVGMTEDVAGTDLELALSALGSVDGRTVTEDVVNGIFSRFCVGK